MRPIRPILCKSVLEILENNQTQPLCAVEIKKLCAKNGLKITKTTFYAVLGELETDGFLQSYREAESERRARVVKLGKRFSRRRKLYELVC